MVVTCSQALYQGEEEVFLGMIWQLWVSQDQYCSLRENVSYNKALERLITKLFHQNIYEHIC